MRNGLRAAISPLGRSLIVAGLLALAGCGTRTYPVTGTVQFGDGQPAKELAGGMVTFDAVDGKVSAHGSIQADGTFRLGTNEPDDGAYPGSYRVAVTPPEPADIDAPRGPRVIDARFERLETSEIVIEVLPRKNEVTIKVERPRP